ncbi:DUF7683 domain-containing protein [Pseudomonas sp. MDT1-17]
MKHVIEVFDRHSEELLLSVEIPNSRHKELAKLMDWHTPEDEFDGYDLSLEQVRTLEGCRQNPERRESHRAVGVYRITHSDVISDLPTQQIPWGSEPARESGLTVDVYVECQSVIASKPAPTGLGVRR